MLTFPLNLDRKFEALDPCIAMQAGADQRQRIQEVKATAGGEGGGSRAGG